MSQNQKEFLYGDLTYEINGILFAVHNELGRFCREKQYSDSIERRFKEKNLPYKRELQIGESGNTCDFLVKDLVLLEIKAKSFLQTEDFEQVQRYLRAANLKLGILINFRGKYLKPQRVLQIQNL